MSKENENPSDGTAGSETKKSGIQPMRLIGILLLVVAAFLYAHDLREGRRRVSGANAVRYVAEASVLGLGLRASPAGSSADSPIYEPCSTEIASNILVRLANAEPVKSPALESMARSYDLFLFLTNRTRVFLSARRQEGSDIAFVSLKEPRRTSDFGSKTDRVSFVEFPPALVTGLGGIFDEIDSGALAALRGARLLPHHGVKAWTNLVRRVGTAGLDEEALKSTALSLKTILGNATLSGAGLAKGAIIGGEPPKLNQISKDVADEIVKVLSVAADTQIPTDTIEGEEYGILLVFGEGFAANLRVVVQDSSPGDALVGFVELSAPAVAGEAPKFTVSSPALVGNLGAIIAEEMAKIQAGQGAPKRESK